MIAPYLPYGLNILYTDKEGDKELHVMGIHDDGGKVRGADEPDGYPNFSLAVCWRPEHRFRSNGYFYIQANYKPILRPLSQIIQKINHNGERFVPYKKLGWESGDMLISCVKSKTKKDLPYRDAVKLFEWGFDVFSLIPLGLAIEKGAEG